MSKLTGYYQRSCKGISLLEMVVSIALSGIFVLMLSGMLSQTLQLSAASQNELIAATAAEELIESAKVSPFSTLQSLIGQDQTLLMNADQSGALGSSIRLRPVQLDLTDNANAYGIVDAQGQLITSNKWDLTQGNYFRGVATQAVSDGSALSAGMPSVLVTVTIKYLGTNGSFKSLSRTALIFQNGARFQ